MTLEKKRAFLVLEDGSVYRGTSFGAEKSAYGEVVFSTSMTGYQEMLTDPSYAGQVVVPTYPLIGNYGVNERDFESSEIRVSGFAVREHCAEPSHSLSTSTLEEFLASQGIPGISGLDTRAITRRLRTQGVMMGAIAVGEPPEAAPGPPSRVAELRRRGLRQTGQHHRRLSVGTVCFKARRSGEVGRNGDRPKDSGQRLRAQVQHPAHPAVQGVRGYRVPGHRLGRRAPVPGARRGGCCLPDRGTRSCWTTPSIPPGGSWARSR